MKNLQISDNDLFGNRFNGHDLHFYLREKGIESNQLVWQKRSQDPYTFEIARNIENRYKINLEASSLHKAFYSHANLYPFSYSLFFDPLFLDADIVHYHLIHNYFFNIFHLPMLTKLKATVWTLHDPWAVTGHCIHFYSCDQWKRGCGECPNLRSDFAVERDATALNWALKQQIYSMSKLDIVVVSGWMYEVAKASPLLRNFDIHLIPLGINSEHFYPVAKAEAKRFFDIPKQKKVLAFRATTDSLKGLQSIKMALNGLDIDDVALLTNDGSGLLDEFKNRYQVIDMGWIHDLNTMRNFYSAADLFLMPSRAETFGLSAIEAMACGTPVIGFDGTALTDTIGAPVSGITVPLGSHEALRAAVKELLTDERRRGEITEAALERIRVRHGLTGYINQVTDLYREVIAKRQPDQRVSYIIGQLENIKHFSVAGAGPDVCSADSIIPLAESMARDPDSRFWLDKLKARVKQHHRLARILRPVYSFFKEFPIRK